jgi:hypothetical protein
MTKSEFASLKDGSKVIALRTVTEVGFGGKKVWRHCVEGTVGEVLMVYGPKSEVVTVQFDSPEGRSSITDVVAGDVDFAD